MGHDLAALEAWAAGLLASMGEGERRKLLRKIGIALRSGESKRIASQKAPDGSSYAPRARRSLADRRSSLRGKASGPMFRRLRSPRFLRIETSADEINVGYTGTAGRIAGVHHHGLRDRVSRQSGAPVAQYPERPLIGFNDTNRGVVMDLILEHVNR